MKLILNWGLPVLQVTFLMHDGLLNWDLQKLGDEPQTAYSCYRFNFTERGCAHVGQ